MKKSDNFDIRKFLTENKVTKASLLKENIFNTPQMGGVEKSKGTSGYINNTSKQDKEYADSNRIKTWDQLSKLANLNAEEESKIMDFIETSDNNEEIINWINDSFEGSKALLLKHYYRNNPVHDNNSLKENSSIGKNYPGTLTGEYEGEPQELEGEELYDYLTGIADIATNVNDFVTKVAMGITDEKSDISEEDKEKLTTWYNQNYGGLKEDKDQEKLDRYNTYTYTLNGKIVKPDEINFYDNLLGAEFNGKVYRLGIPEDDTVELREPKGKTGIYTEGTTKFTKSSLKQKIKEMILAEIGIEDLDEAKKKKKNKKEEAPEEEIDLNLDDNTGEEDLNLDTEMGGGEDLDISTDEVDPTIKAVQDALTQAQSAAEKLNDPKLSKQIGNTITQFTRTHISNKGVSGGGDMGLDENLDEMRGKPINLNDKLVKKLVKDAMEFYKIYNNSVPKDTMMEKFVNKFIEEYGPTYD